MNQKFLEENDLEPLKLLWWKYLLFKFWPQLAFKVMAKEMKISNLSFDKLHDVFIRTKKIDIFPNRGNSRGFILVLDREIALYFYQNGKSFKYDGFEIGKYNQGDVTIFDNLKFRKSPYVY